MLFVKIRKFYQAGGSRNKLTKFLASVLFVAISTALPVSEEHKNGNQAEDIVSEPGPTTRLVFQSFSQVRQTLENPQILHMAPEVSELNRILARVNTTSFSSCVDRKFPLIVVEGLDGAGKSTLCQEVGERLGFRVIKNVPPPAHAFKALLSRFDESAPVRRAWMAGGNYVAAQEIADLCTQYNSNSNYSSLSSPSLPKGVLMDRFWSTTGTLGIAEKKMKFGMDSVSPSDYVWPLDLFQPDFVIFLDVNEENRNFRVHHRRPILTKNEQHIENSLEYRQLLIDSFNRIQGPKVIHVDVNNSNMPPNATEEENIKALANHVCGVIEQNLDPRFKIL